MDIRTSIQKLAKAMMAPLPMIVAAGLLLGIASLLTNTYIFGDSLSNIVVIDVIVSVVNNIASELFSLLPVLFAMALAMGFTREDRSTAVFASVIGFALFHTTISYILSFQGITEDTVTIEALQAAGMTLEEATRENATYNTELGIFTYRMSIFGGMIVGAWTAFIHNKFHRTQLPTALSFFSGTRLVPIMVTFTIPFVALVSAIIWPYFSLIINAFGNLIESAGVFGLFLYGFLERLLIPTGLHHILNQLIRFTAIGGTAVVDGETVSGAYNIFSALLLQGDYDMDVMRYATRFLTQGTHPFMVFGLPAACYAMYKTALPENKAKVKGVLLAAGLTSFVTGITEPIEFSFIFVSPVLWLFHACMAGLSFVINYLLGVSIGNASGGLLDLAVFGILRGSETRWYINVAIGIVYAIVYYNVFKYVIVKMNVKTPGRDTDESLDFGTVSVTELGSSIMEALGGAANIEDIDNCISRLRLVLVDTSVVDESALKATGAMGIIKINEKNIQVVYGNKVETAAHELKDAVKQARSSLGAAK